MTRHVLKPGTFGGRTYCGRRAGTPGGVIYPGVLAEPRAWYEEHRYPAVAARTCRRCLSLSGTEVGIVAARAVLALFAWAH